MMTRALPAVIGLLSISLPLFAQAETETISSDALRETGALEVAPALTLSQPNVFSNVDSTALIHGLPVLTLLDGRRFPLASDLGRMGVTPSDLVPMAFLSSVEVQKVGSSPIYGSDGPGGVLNLNLNRMHAGGEAGIFYGKSSGKYGVEDKQAYIIGTVGNDKFQITAGASYTETEFRVPRRGR